MIDYLLNVRSVVEMSPLENELHGRLIGSVAFKDAEGFFRPVEFPARNIPTGTAGVAQPLRLRQIGLAALQFGGPFRHLRLEFVTGLAQLSLALAYRFLGACRTKCGSGMIRRYGEQQLVNFGRKVGVIACRRNKTALGIDPDGDHNTTAVLRAIADLANDFPLRQAAVDGEMRLQPFRKCLPCASSCDFDRGPPVRIA